MSKSSLLENINEVLLLTKELAENENLSQSQKAEILKKIASIIKDPLTTTPVRLERIHLQRCLSRANLYSRIDWSKYEKELSGEKEYEEKGILLINGIEHQLKSGKKPEGNEIWLLITGHFLRVKSKFYDILATLPLYDGEDNIYGYTYDYVWKGEATEIIDPSELSLSRGEILEITARIILKISQILSTIEKVNENQQELLFNVLNNLSWHGSLATPSSKNWPRLIDWEKSIQPVINKLLAQLSPKTVLKLGQEGINNLVEICLRARLYLLKIEELYPTSYIEELGPEIVKTLIMELSNANKDIRRLAAVWLGVIGAKEAVEPLIKTLKDEELWVKLAVIDALGKIGDKSAIGPLKQLFEQKKYRKEAAKAIGMIDPTTLEPYVSMLEEAIEIKNGKALITKSSYEEKARKAIEHLILIGNEEAVDLIIHHFRNVSHSYLIEIFIAKYLGKVGSDKAIEALLYVYDREKKRGLEKYGVGKIVEEVLDQLGMRPKSLLGKLFRR